MIPAVEHAIAAKPKEEEKRRTTPQYEAFRKVFDEEASTRLPEQTTL